MSLSLYVLLHNHRYGITVYPLLSDKEKLSEEEARAALTQEIDFQPDWEETLELDATELKAVPVLIGDTVAADLRNWESFVRTIAGMQTYNLDEPSLVDGEDATATFNRVIEVARNLIGSSEVHPPTPSKCPRNAKVKLKSVESK